MKDNYRRNIAHQMILLVAIVSQGGTQVQYVEDVVLVLVQDDKSVYSCGNYKIA